MGAAMHSADGHALRPLALSSQFACYPEWLKIEVALRLVLTQSWPPEAWQEGGTFRGCWRRGSRLRWEGVV
jgi:hypothetical protein